MKEQPAEGNGAGVLGTRGPGIPFQRQANGADDDDGRFFIPARELHRVARGGVITVVDHVAARHADERALTLLDLPDASQDGGDGVGGDEVALEEVGEGGVLKVGGGVEAGACEGAAVADGVFEVRLLDTGAGARDDVDSVRGRTLASLQIRELCRDGDGC